MPLYQVDIEKRLGSEFWSNRWIVQAATLASAVLHGQAIVASERTIHHLGVEFTRYRAATLIKGDNIYTIVALGLFGQRNPVGELLPLFNTLRADINALAGRPSRKYFRGVLTESDISGSAVVADFSAFVPNFGDLMATSGDPEGIVDPQGEHFNAFIWHRNVQMRQLRRSRRKRNNGAGIFQ